MTNIAQTIADFSNEVSNLVNKAAHQCKANLPTPIVSIGGHVYTFLAFRERNFGENKVSYAVRESVATLAKLYFLVAAATFAVVALKASGALLLTSICVGAVFAAARSDAVANLFKAKVA